jgi:hypothetical protein
MNKKPETLFAPEEMPDAIIDRVSLDLILRALTTQVEAKNSCPDERMSSSDRGPDNP